MNTLKHKDYILFEFPEGTFIKARLVEAHPEDRDSNGFMEWRVHIQCHKDLEFSMQEIEVIGNILFSDKKPIIIKRSEYKRWNKIGSDKVFTKVVWSPDYKSNEVIEYNTTYIVELIKAPEKGQPHLFLEIEPDNYVKGYIAQMVNTEGHKAISVLVKDVEGD